MRTKLLLFSLILLCLATPAQAADINAASCSQADVQAAINSAVGGDRVLVPAGSCTWTTPVIIPNTKGIVLEGAGIDVTIITDGITTASTLTVNIQSGNSLAVVTGFTFNANSVVKTAAHAEIAIEGGGLDSFRIHHNKITNLRKRGIKVSAQCLPISGLIDNNTIEAPGSFSVQGYTLFGCDSLPSPAHLRPLGLGTSENIFIEDNTFNYSFLNDETGTVTGSASYVFRYNTVIGTSGASHHGADSGGRRGVHSFEIYNNTLSTSFSISRTGLWRSGVGVFFNNTATGPYQSGHQIANFRSCSPQNPIWGGACDGTNAWDENTGGFEGWRCRDQVGSFFQGGQGVTPESQPLYAWNNMLNGQPVNVVKTSPANSCSRFQDLHMIEGRDFINGTARPGYTPFTYPHPLQAGGGGNPRPDPPANLGAIVR